MIGCLCYHVMDVQFRFQDWRDSLIGFWSLDSIGYKEKYVHVCSLAFSLLL